MPRQPFFLTDGHSLFTPAQPPVPAGRREHPGCGFVYKHGQKETVSVLHTPIGRITCRSDGEGNITRPYLKTPRDVEILREYLRSVVIYPGSEGECYSLGQSPGVELRRVWAGESYEALQKSCPAAMASAQRRLGRIMAKRIESLPDASKALFVLEDNLEAGDEDAFLGCLAHYEALCARFSSPFVVTTTAAALALWASPQARGISQALQKRLQRHGCLRDGLLRAGQEQTGDCGAQEVN